MSYRTRFLVGLFSLASGFLLAQVPPEERIPVTDPDRLEKMGFPRNATNIYLWSRADLGGGGGADPAGVEAADAWGTAVGYTTIPGLELKAEWDEFHKLVRHADRIACSDNTYFEDLLRPTAVARIEAPEGASLSSFRFWAQDADPDRDLSFDVQETCQDLGRNTPVTTVIGSSGTLGAIGNYFGAISLHGLTVNNRTCSYSVRVDLAKCDVSVARYVNKMQVLWRRQVSPAPAAASFSDVPTTSPQFRFVEALVKAGITAGCGSGNFCPNDPITRGQMAVFLSTALGLQWP